MTTAAILSLIGQYGPSIIPVVQQLVSWVEQKKETVTAADLELLATLGGYSSVQALANLGIAIIDGKVVQLPPKA